MYRLFVAARIRQIFARLDAGDWETMTRSLAPRFTYRFYGATTPSEGSATRCPPCGRGGSASSGSCPTHASSRGTSWCPLALANAGRDRRGRAGHAARRDAVQERLQPVRAPAVGPRHAGTHARRHAEAGPGASDPRGQRRRRGDGGAYHGRRVRAERRYTSRESRPTAGALPIPGAGILRRPRTTSTGRYGPTGETQ